MLLMKYEKARKPRSSDAIFIKLKAGKRGIIRKVEVYTDRSVICYKGSSVNHLHMSGRLSDCDDEKLKNLTSAYGLNLGELRELREIERGIYP